MVVASTPSPPHSDRPRSSSVPLRLLGQGHCGAETLPQELSVCGVCVWVGGSGGGGGGGRRRGEGRCVCVFFCFCRLSIGGSWLQKKQTTVTSASPTN